MRFKYTADACPTLTLVDESTGLVVREELPPEGRRYVSYAPDGTAVYGSTAPAAIKAAKKYAAERREACGYA